MKKWFKIEEFAIFRKVAYYTIRSENDLLSETDKFLEKFSTIERHKEKLNKLIAFIESMGVNMAQNKSFLDTKQPQMLYHRLMVR